MLPDAKIIAILRDPVDRAYSAYNFNRSRGVEPAATFNEAIEAELSRARSNWMYGWRYLETGLYAKHLRRYFDHFPISQIRVLKFEDLKSQPSATFSAVCTFLGLPFSSADVARPSNATRYHRNVVLRSLKASLNRPNPARTVVRSLLPPARREIFKKVLAEGLDKFGTPPPKMSLRDRATLASYFEEPNKALQALTSFDISDWTTAHAM